MWKICDTRYDLIRAGKPIRYGRKKQPGPFADTSGWPFSAIRGHTAPIASAADRYLNPKYRR
ncbi:hypothetical protein CRP01_10110 [Flavilitoribacter nigricans DSM 23189 = NBRC 102662]|uniref:Uncharacterized protein n=1 Tax=Flavilitoribacter nigricans (strain ATCC 23147 / DSM 23189 / NBRC 102662 / NCIMB 1420 / SS-2) TaxID=1122177 RepID=A0A2D0NDQ3_FLAN2|nr:hypothetical protein CRP01_10110 [Flavilitoribacter nigricans DSM 23189 = NBRC 102662]